MYTKGRHCTKQLERLISFLCIAGLAHSGLLLASGLLLLFGSILLLLGLLLGLLRSGFGFLCLELFFAFLRIYLCPSCAREASKASGQHRPICNVRGSS